MIRNNISNLFNHLNNLLKIDIKNLEQRSNIYSSLKTNNLKKMNLININ